MIDAPLHASPQHPIPSWRSLVYGVDTVDHQIRFFCSYHHLYSPRQPVRGFIYPQRPSGQAVITGIVPFSHRVHATSQLFHARRFSSIFMATHALALVKKKSPSRNECLFERFPTPIIGFSRDEIRVPLHRRLVIYTSAQRTLHIAHLLYQPPPLLPLAGVRRVMLLAFLPLALPL